MNTNGHFPTTNLALATYLIGSGHKLVTILYENRQAAFIFKTTPQLLAAVDAFKAGDASITLPKDEFIRGNLLDRIKRGE